MTEADQQGFQSSAETEVTYFKKGTSEAQIQQREVICESPLTIEIEDGDNYTIMRTPGADLDLTMGFLFAEGLIDGPGDVRALEPCGNDRIVRALLRELPKREARRNLVINSSCGLCGHESIEALVADLPNVDAGIALSVETLFQLPNTFRDQQELFHKTGGSHAAALFDSDGRLLVVCEDLGRHSALDKAIGKALRQDLKLSDLGIFISGRTSLEMVVKAARARISVLVAVSAPSFAAVSVAEQLGITICGFARGEELAIYCHAQRISGPGGS